MSSDLPIQAIKDDLLSAWHRGGAIVSAPPGSGKTTQLPLWLMASSTSPVYLLIPKRLAVKLAAKQLAHNLGEDVGNRVGYQLRNDQKTSRQTQLIVTTYGSFLRILLNNPDQLTHATVIFDEFHERSVEQDLCYALVNQYVEYFDDQVRRVIMSATLNVEKIIHQTQLPLIESKGFSYPIEISYEKSDIKNSQLIASIIRKHWQNTEDHLLVFCAGLSEIRNIEQQLPPTISVLILHGQLAKTPNLLTLVNAPSTVILSTNIAESSVTLPRVHTVVDLGIERYANTHPVTGITELKTRQISQASAKQRAGRAGRLAPGKCIRLWSIDDQKSLVAHQPPEITYADLTELVIHCSQWGTTLNDLIWLDKPSNARWQLALDKLNAWQALDASGQLNDHGQAMQKIGLQPWLSHLIALAKANNTLESAVLLAAHLTTGQPITYDLHKPQKLANFNQAIAQEYRLTLKKLDTHDSNSISAIAENILIQALADRVIHWRTHNQGLLITGTEVKTTQPTNEKWGLLLDGIRKGQCITATSWIAVSGDIVRDTLTLKTEIRFLPDANRSFVQIKRLGKITISENTHAPSAAERSSAWLNYIEKQGEMAFRWEPETLAFKERWLLASQILPSWPNWPQKNEWKALASAFFGGLKRFEQLPLNSILEHALGYEYQSKMNTLLPQFWSTPTQRKVAIHYDAQHKKAKIQIKLQEIFGLAQHPCLADTLPLTLELTAPNGRPVASVTDLSHFWRNVYPEVRKELRGRYAKHPWPEDPINFEPTAKTNRQLRLDSQ